ncbi:MAG: hypothetical protein KDB52_09965 [Solirubrobacterales bacterium]|nr:hypothetical protein [Solirubrobacterales bacterium]
MADPDPKPEGEDSPELTEGRTRRPWLRVALAGLALLLVAGGLGFGVGYLTRSDDSGPELTGQEAFVQASDRTGREITRAMAERGFVDGKRSGRSHGIIAGGMAAESAVTLEFRQLRAAEAQNQAAEAQSELAGMSGGAPPIPDFSSGEDGE